MFPISQLCLTTNLKLPENGSFSFGSPRFLLPPPNGLYVFINFRNIDATVFHTFVKLFYVYLMAR